MFFSLVAATLVNEKGKLALKIHNITYEVSYCEKY